LIERTIAEKQKYPATISLAKLLVTSIFERTTDFPCIPSKSITNLSTSSKISNMLSWIVKCVKEVSWKNNDDRPSLSKEKPSIDSVSPPVNLIWILAFIGSSKSENELPFLCDSLLSNVFCEQKLVEIRELLSEYHRRPSQPNMNNIKQFSESAEYYGLEVELYVIDFLSDKFSRRMQLILKEHLIDKLYVQQDAIFGVLVIMMCCPSVFPLMIGDLLEKCLSSVFFSRIPPTDNNDASILLYPFASLIIDVIKSSLILHDRISLLKRDCFTLMVLLEKFSSTSYLSAIDSETGSTIVNQIFDVKKLLLQRLRHSLYHWLYYRKNPVTPSDSSELSKDAISSMIEFLRHMTAFLNPICRLLYYRKNSFAEKVTPASNMELINELDHSNETAFSLLEMIGLCGEEKVAGEILFQVLVEPLSYLSLEPNVARSNNNHVLGFFFRLKSIFEKYYPNCIGIFLDLLLEKLCSGDGFLLDLEQSQSFSLVLISSMNHIIQIEQNNRSLYLMKTSSGIAYMLCSQIQRWNMLFSLVYHPSTEIRVAILSFLISLESMECLQPESLNASVCSISKTRKCAYYFLSLLQTKIPGDTCERNDIINTKSYSFINESSFPHSHRRQVLELIKCLVSKVARSNDDSLSQLIDILFDFILSDRAVGVLTEASQLRLPPANSIALPIFPRLISPLPNRLFTISENCTEERPSDISSFLRSLVVTAGDNTTDDVDTLICENLLEKNRKRSLSSFGMTPISLSLKNKNKKNNNNNNNNNLQSNEGWDYAGVENAYYENQRDFVDLLERILQDTTDSLSSRKLKSSNILVSQFLDRLVNAVDMIPTYEQYDEILPHRTNFARDEYVNKIFTQNPVLFSILGILGSDPDEFFRCLELVKSLLANLIGYWFAQGNSAQNLNPTKSTLFSSTCSLISLLGKVHWIHSPLSLCPEIFGFITAKEISAILMSIWNFLRNFPPSIRVTRTKTDFQSQMDPYLIPLKIIVRNNISKLAIFSPKFFKYAE